MADEGGVSSRGRNIWTGVEAFKRTTSHRDRKSLVVFMNGVPKEASRNESKGKNQGQGGKVLSIIT